jgi:hypothetical protein
MNRSEVLATRYVWRVHGRGLSTSVGVHTRRLIKAAYKAGYRAAINAAIAKDAE